MVRKRNILAQDIGKGSISIFALERRRAVQHFVDENTKSPPVNCARVAAALDDLGGNVLLSADERIGTEICDTGTRINSGQRVRSGTIFADNHGRLATGARLLRQIKVRKHNVPRLMQKDVCQ